MKHNKLFLLMLALMFSLLAACSPTAPTAAPKPTSAPDTTSSNFPAGKFIQSGKTDYGLIFNKDGTFSVFDGGTTLVTGTYSVDGNVYTETSNDGG